MAVDRVVTMPFRVVAVTSFSKVAATSVVTELELKPSNLGARVAAIAPSFEYFRVSKLRSELFSSIVGPVRNRDAGVTDVTIGTIDGEMFMSYEPSDASRTGAPTTRSEMAQAALFTGGNPYAKLAFDVPRKVLLGTPVKWFDTASTGSPPSGNLVQGLVWVLTLNYHTNDASSASEVLNILEGTIEFRGMISPALSKPAPMPILQQTERKDYDDDCYSMVETKGPPSARGRGDGAMAPGGPVLFPGLTSPSKSLAPRFP